MSAGKRYLPNFIGDRPLKTVEVQTEYVYYVLRNIESIGLSLICVVSDNNEKRKRYFKLSRQCNTN